MRATLFKVGAASLLLAALGLQQASAQFLEARDVGDNPRGSIVTNEPGSYTIVGGGHEPWGNADDYFFAYQPILGDFDVQVRIEWLEASGRWSKAGIMARPSLNYRTPFVYVRETPTGPDCNGNTTGNDICMSGRRGDQAEQGSWDDGCVGKYSVSNNWVRLVRTGSIMTALRSPDGINWTALDTEDTATYSTGPFPPWLLVGLCTSRHNDAGACLTARSEYRNYQFNSLNLAQVSSRGNPGGIYVHFTRPVSEDALNPAHYTVMSSNGNFYWVGNVTYHPWGMQNVVVLDVSPEGGGIDPLQEGDIVTVIVTGVVDQSDPPRPLVGDPATAIFMHGQGYEEGLVHQYLIDPTLPGGTFDPGNTYNYGLPVYRASSLYGPPVADERRLHNLFEQVWPDSVEGFNLRMVALLNPPLDGNYTFAVSTDDNSILYLSSDDQPANGREICREPTWNGYREYLTGSNQAERGDPPANISAPQTLQAGVPLALDLIMNEGCCGNPGSATWVKPGDPPLANGQNPIGDLDLLPSRFFNNTIFFNLGPVQITRDPASATQFENLTVTFSVGVDGTPAYFFQWYKNNVAIPGATGRSYTTPPLTQADDGSVFKVHVWNEFSEAWSGEAVLTVIGAPLLLSATSRGNCHGACLTWSIPVQLDGTYTVVDNLGNPHIVTGIGYGAASNEVCLTVEPDLVPDTATYYVTATGVHSLPGILQEPDPAQVSFVHGSEYPAFRILYKKYDTRGGPLPIAQFLALPKVVNDQPDQIRTDFTAFETPGSENGSYYGAIMLGWLTVPADGDYRLWTASDDYSATYIATDGNPAHKVLVASEPQWNDFRAFATCDRRTCDGNGWPVETRSPAFTLSAGQVVYLEAVYTEGGGGDHYSAYATVVPVGDPDPGPPGNGTPSNLGQDLFVLKRLSPNRCLFETLCDVFAAVPPTDQTQYVGLSATFTVKADGTPAAGACYYYQWSKNGTPIPGATADTYITPPLTLGDDGAVYSVEIRNDFSTSSCSAAVHVLPNPVLVRCSSLNDPNHVYIYWNRPVNLDGTYTVQDEFGAFYLVNFAAYGENQSIVVLDTDPLPEDTSFTVTVTGVTDLDGNTMLPDPQTCGFRQGPNRYCVNFDDGNLPPGTIAFQGDSAPGPGVENGYMRLSTTVNSQRNYWIIPLNGLQTFGSFRAQWKSLLGPADNFGNRADGFSFNVGTSLGTAFTPEDGAANGLSLCVDTYNNGNSEVGIEIRWNGQRVGFTPIHGGARHGPEELMKQQWVDTYVDVTPSGFVTFRYDTFQVTAQLPSFSGITANQYVFAARTGGANENCWIDDLCINDFTLAPIANVTIVPTAVTVVEGRQVTFSASASGSPPHTYQWQRDDGAGWTDIPGAINPIYSFLASMADNGANFRVRVANGFSSAASDPATVTVVPAVYGRGALLFEVYNTGLGACGAGNSEVDKLTSHPSFPDSPVERYYLSRFDTRAVYPDDSHEGYGGRISGLFCPPETGDWVFYLRSDDASELWLNPTGTDPAGKVKILEELGCCRQFADLYTTNPIPLVAGQCYYIEGLYKEGCGGDYLQVAAQLAGQPPPIDPTSQSIPGAWLQAVIDPNANASVAITEDPTNYCAIIQPPSPPTVLLASDFSADNGGFWVTNFPNDISGYPPPGPWTWGEAAGTWSCFGEDCPPYNGPYASGLVSPPIVVPSAGGVALTFAHRFSFESGAWDGGVLLMSVNGGAWTVVPPANFFSNGYNGVILGNTVGGNLLQGAPAFVNESTDYGVPAYITSSAGLGFFNAGDIIIFGFVTSWDEGCQGTVPNWEIDRVEVTLGVEVPVSATFQVGATATAYGIAMTPAYQWQRNDGLGWTDIPGANAATLTLAGVQLSDDGAQFRCVAVVPGASATSAEATLTVIAGCGSISIERQGINPADAVIIIWNSVTWDEGQYCELYGATELVDGGPGTVWVKVQATDPDVIALEPGRAVLRPGSPYKFFRTASPRSCP